MSAKCLDRAIRAYSNLNAFNAVISVLEGGCIYGGNPRTDRVAQKIIGLCQEEQQRLLREYDAACAGLSPVNPPAKDAE